ncbi:hypothetical protein HPB50_003632 [Hyalomma asiaticum]|uniref:Uncharacterized protein n=1 Tax=Hyalomma asiaticum TaxID=266040 RepID=A0ACB7TDW8_HYAAI|nr:hypothetical protein HPB50_003632 [Hyalomma asiaticum]
MESRPQLSSLNEHISCKLCKGYLIDATTVKDCQHTFCKSCLVKYLEDKNTCPTCDTVIHPSYPLKYIRHDSTMQDIVYKLVPNLQFEEMKRQREFYQHKGLPCPMALHPGVLNETDAGSTASCSNENEAKSSKDLVEIFLESGSTQFKQLHCKFIRCSSKASITTLKKFVAVKLFNSIDRYNEIDILCKEEILGNDHTVESVYVTRWKVKRAAVIGGRRAAGLAIRGGGSRSHRRAAWSHPSGGSRRVHTPATEAPEDLATRYQPPQLTSR